MWSSKLSFDSDSFQNSYKGLFFHRSLIKFMVLRKLENTATGTLKEGSSVGLLPEIEILDLKEIDFTL